MMSTGERANHYYRSEKYFILWLAQKAMDNNELNQDQKDFVTDMGLITLILLSEWLHLSMDENLAVVKAKQYFTEQRFKYCTDIIVEYGGYKKRIFATK